MARGLRPVESNSYIRGGIQCLVVSPSDPLTGGPRAGPLKRILNPPNGVRYTLATDRLTYPARAARYEFNPANVALVTARFALEHLIPLEERGISLVHSFFWDVRKFKHRWVHESDQSFGQFLSGYNNISGLVRKWTTEGFSSYLNSRWCAGVVTWSEWAKRGFVDDGVDPSKVKVIPPPFKTIDYRKDHEGCNLLFLGRDFYRKGGDSVLRAFRAIKTPPDCRLVYVGPVDSEGERKATRLDSRIVQADMMSTKVLVNDVWPTTDIFVLPTRADAFAITVVEAMRRGIPVVSSRNPAISEVVQNEVSGFLTDAGDVGGLKNNLQRLVDDPELRKRMGENARSRAASLFSPEEVNKSLGDLYRLAL